MFALLYTTTSLAPCDLTKLATVDTICASSKPVRFETSELNGLPTTSHLAIGIQRQSLRRALFPQCASRNSSHNTWVNTLHRHLATLAVPNNRLTLNTKTWGPVRAPHPHIPHDCHNRSSVYAYRSLLTRRRLNFIDAEYRRAAKPTRSSTNSEPFTGRAPLLYIFKPSLITTP